MTAAELVKILGGRGDSAPCPVPSHGRGRGDRNHSLSAHEGTDGKLLVHCHAGCSQAAVWAEIKRRGLVGDGEISRRRENVAPARKSQKSPEQRRAEARAIWEEARRALHADAHRYLLGRGITIPPPPCLRYHERLRALVALVQARDGSFSGIQRIYLETDSRGVWKRDRLSLGPIRGGAVRLTPPAETIQLTESVEDGAALLQLTARPTWAVPGAEFMVSFDPPPEVRELILAPDHDRKGLEVIEKAINSQPRKQFRQLLPPPGRDWCDLLEDWDERQALQVENLPTAGGSWVEDFVNG